MSEDQIRSQRFQAFEEVLDFGPLERKKAVAEMLNDYFFPLRLRKKQLRAIASFFFAFFCRAKNDPGNFEIRAARKQFEDGSATPDLNIVGVGSQTQDFEWCSFGR